MLQDATHFYHTLDEKLGAPAWKDLQTILEQDTAPKGINKKDWSDIQAAHMGYQAGCDILSFYPIWQRNADSLI